LYILPEVPFLFFTHVSFAVMFTYAVYMPRSSCLQMELTQVTIALARHAWRIPASANAPGLVS
jgi:hypothetical protein